jgi:hypothetical protein
MGAESVSMPNLADQQNSVALAVDLGWQLVETYNYCRPVGFQKSVTYAEQ